MNIQNEYEYAEELAVRDAIPDGEAYYHFVVNMVLFRYKSDLSWQFPENNVVYPWWREHFKRIRQLELLYEQI